METKLALITILTKYKFLRAPETEVHTYILITVSVYNICRNFVGSETMCRYT